MGSLRYASEMHPCRLGYGFDMAAKRNAIVSQLFLHVLSKYVLSEDVKLMMLEVI